MNENSFIIEFVYSLKEINSNYEKHTISSNCKNIKKLGPIIINQYIFFVIHIVKKHSERNMFNVVLQNKKKLGYIIASKELMSKLPELD